jgi:hypothetical protein
MLRSATETPVMNLDEITPNRYMEYILTLRHHRTGNYLSTSAYGCRRSALFHLFRLHNRIGYPNEFRLELNNLFRGFFRNLVQNRQRRITSTNNNIDNNNDNAGDEASVAVSTVARARINMAEEQTDESKVPLSVELMKAICGWLLSYNTCDGVFAHCFLILTWNLACRSNNTACIKLSDMVWSTSFDSFHIFFGHSKTDQTGDDTKYTRHSYSNPTLPLVCPLT